MGGPVSIFADPVHGPRAAFLVLLRSECTAYETFAMVVRLLGARPQDIPHLWERCDECLKGGLLISVRPRD